ncbi:MAG: exosortase A [Novosphingobium sp.]
MPPEAAAISPGQGLLERLPQAWRAPLAWLGVSWLALFALFAADWAAMAGQWWDSSTYNHILLVPAILGWLVWLRAPELAKLAPRAWSPGLATVAAALLVWLLGAVSGLSLLRQAGAVALLPASVLTLLGPRMASALAFPLAYTLLLVPFGDELVPPLQTITAKLTIALTHLSGIPARIDGVFIDTPAGLFVVAEACSGVKFLVAMVAFGALVGNVCFRTWPRRAAFLAVCVVVPILANGVRAWGTIQVAQSMGAEYAGGFDHIVYGWLFFALVIALVLAMAWRFFDRRPDDPMIDGAAIAAAPGFGRWEQASLTAPMAFIAATALVVAAQGWAGAAARLAAPLPPQIFLPEVSGWTRADHAPQLAWKPRAGGAAHRLLGSYADAGGRTVDVFVALYSAQGEGREAGGFGEGALIPDSEWAWAGPGPRAAAAKSERLFGRGRIERIAQTSYRTGAVLTGSNTRLKLATMTDRLILQAHPTMLLIVSAETRPGRPAADAVAAFRASVGPLGPWMDRIAQVR